MEHQSAEQHTCVFGTTRWGKSTLVKRLLRRTRRFVVLERRPEYGDLGSVRTGFRSAVNYLQRHQTGRCRLIHRTPNMAEQLAMIRLLWTIHSAPGNREPTALVIEEARDYSDPSSGFISEPEAVAVGRDGTPYQAKVYSEGLFHNLVALTIFQQPSMVSRKVTRASVWKVAVRFTGGMSGDEFASLRRRREKLASLKRITPDVRPTNGTHYLTDPPDLDLESEWSDQFHP